ncbi:MAG: prolyl oligopeptidase family serine peptidase [Serratia symbiotica]|nr:prolyl oligopeptidase family serine peptidase [Serratia symbiotica]
MGGSSAGGLLIGAVMNQVPQLLHRVVVAQVPFVDVVTTRLDESIPLTTGEYD